MRAGRAEGSGVACACQAICGTGRGRERGGKGCLPASLPFPLCLCLSPSLLFLPSLPPLPSPTPLRGFIVSPSSAPPRSLAPRHAMAAAMLWPLLSLSCYRRRYHTRMRVYQVRVDQTRTHAPAAPRPALVHPPISGWHAGRPVLTTAQTQTQP